MKCDECGGYKYRGPGAAQAGEKVCTCAEDRHTRRKEKHAEAAEHLKAGLAVADRPNMAGADRTAALLRGLTLSALAIMEASAPGDY